MADGAQTKVKGMCIATRCTSIDHFVEMFHRFVDEDSFFVSTANTRPPGLETSFSVQLADGTPVLRGLCVVLQAWTAPNSPFKTPGVRLGIKRLTASSMPIFERLLVTRSKPPAPIKAPTPVALPVHKHKPNGTPTEVMPALPKVIVAEEMRTPGSDYILPANPLMNLTDESLEGYVDCTLYEETANYFPAEDDHSLVDAVAPPPVQRAEPPVFAPRPVGNHPAPIELVADEPPISASELASVIEDAPTLTVVSVAEPLPIEPSLVEALPVAPPPLSATPPPLPQRASPVIPPTPTPPMRAASPITRESLPAGELAAIPRIKARRRRWPLVAGAAVLAAATIISISALGSHDAPPIVASKPVTMPEAERPIAEPPQPPPPAVAAPAVDKPAIAPEPTAAPHDTDPADSADPGEAAADSDAPPAGDAERPTAGDGPCRINVASTPAGSIVSLDGAAVAPSPIAIETTCARHKIEIKHPRYMVVTKMVSPTEGEPATLETTMQRPTHSVSFSSQPTGATVFIDGRRAGTTPTNVSVMGFTNLKIEIKKTGYAPLSTHLYSKTAQDKFSTKLTKW